jgi:hypothetical protein
MTSLTSTPWWPLFTIAALGLFHGANPAMGWLFAVALGLHRGSRNVVLLSAVAISLAHLTSVTLFACVALAFRSLIDQTWFGRIAGVFLLCWAAWHACRGHRRHARVGMQTGLAGLSLWSFAIASAHGAGLMLIPALMSRCASATTPGLTSGVPALAVTLAVHTGAMLLTIVTISIIVYERVGLAFLRTGWVNLDRIWIGALAACGGLLLAS